MEWMKQVRTGEYVLVSPNQRGVVERTRLMKVSKTTKNSIFIGQMQFAKKTGIQWNQKRKIQPFLAQHL